jgi:hypothetical protein
MDQIYISIASYRDPDLINTVRNCWDSAYQKDRLHFSIVSQAEDNEHPDLSFIPDEQISYVKMNWSEAKGACWARSIASEGAFGTYFLQIDSHSRFLPSWDSLITQNYTKVSKYWGKKIILTNYPDPFTVDENGADKYINYQNLRKLDAYWDEDSKMIQSWYDWPDVIETTRGDEVFFLSGNSMFCPVDVIKEVPYDKELYFTGEEPSMALRAYTRGIKLISPIVKYMYTNYLREVPPRRLHWEDHKDWGALNKKSYERLAKIMTGDKSLGVYGIGDEELYKLYQFKTGINLEDKYDIIYNVYS